MVHPVRYIEAASRVLGEIDLDPASSVVAQKTVQAKRYFTAADDGLSKVWSGRVWLNPPYERGMVEQFTEKLSESLSTEGGAVTEAILLVNNATDTGWFQDIAPSADAICFVRGGFPSTMPMVSQKTSHCRGRCSCTSVVIRTGLWMSLVSSVSALSRARLFAERMDYDHTLGF